MSWVLKQVFPVNQFRVYAINGVDLFVANDDFAIRHWNVLSKEVVGILRGHKGKITDLEYSEELKVLFSTSIDGYLLCWYNGNLIAQFINKERRSDCFGSPLHSVTFYPRTNQIIVGAVGELIIFQFNWEAVQQAHDRHEILILKPFNRMKLHRDVIHRSMCAGDKLITASLDRTIGYSRLDSLSVNKVLPLNQKQAICNFTYDAREELVFIGTIDGKIHAVTRDGLLIQRDSIGYECGVVSLAVDHSIGLLWAVMDCGDIRLLDLHNFTTDLTDYFDTHRERPIIGVEKHRFFGVHYDKKSRSMFAFCNDHYIFEFKFDESAARVTFLTNSPMHSLTVVDYYGIQKVDAQGVKDLLAGEEHLKVGKYIFGGDRKLQIYLQRSRFQYDLVHTIKAKSHTTAVAFSNRFFVFGDDKGYFYCIKVANMQMCELSNPLKSAISSIHITNTHIILTTLSGDWGMFSLELFPEPLEETTGRELAHNGAINDSVFDESTGTLLTVGTDGMLKQWKLSDHVSKGLNHQSSNLFLTENDQVLSESSVADMRKFGEVLNIRWAKKADRWVTVHSDSQIRVWTTDILNIRLLITIPCGGCHISALALDDPDVILAAVDDKTVRCFAMATGELVRTYTGHKDIICNLYSHPDTDYYVSTSWDGAVKIWSKCDLKIPKISSSIYSNASSKRTDKNAYRRKARPATAITKPKSAVVYQPISLYEKRKQEIERRRRRERAEFEAKMRSPVAKELQSIAKTLLEHM
ncbi:hypothetical protein TRFO_06415 [Tritrichomonas foetus]|uniref:WD repeat protein n=1 Tax=Tritrichomonas foetus TaxID=1144522 RepID=A0A1J4K056_9EUKA|nr:hypothetical protein TRFO_06415 [Tritrichomonas foetus]|eukprot:OHT04112.1 hypothetical protein TRFO_06415 [Tritrichomonas foetus]